MTLGTEVLVGGIIAAGEGRRLREDGFNAPKPLVSVAGVPLLEGVVRNFLAANIVSLTVIVNESERECVEWAAARFPTLDVRFIVRTTASSLESFTRVLGAAPSGPLVVSTVDAWCRPEDFARFVEAARRRPPEATVLAVAPLAAVGRCRRGRPDPARGGRCGQRGHGRHLRGARARASVDAAARARAVARVPRLARRPRRNGLR